jgi:hypothetical protein
VHLGTGDGGMEWGELEGMLEGTTKGVVVGACEGPLLGKGEGTGVALGAEVRVGICVGSRVEVEGEPVGGFVAEASEGTGVTVGAEGRVGMFGVGSRVEVDVEGEPVGGFVAEAFEGTGVTVGAEGRVDIFGFLRCRGASSGRKYCDLAEYQVPRKRLTVSRPPTGVVARAESVVTTTLKTAALDREAGAVFMIHSMSLTSGSEFSRVCRTCGKYASCCKTSF